MSSCPMEGKYSSREHSFIHVPSLFYSLLLLSFVCLFLVCVGRSACCTGACDGRQGLTPLINPQALPSGFVCLHLFICLFLLDRFFPGIWTHLAHYVGFAASSLHELALPPQSWGDNHVLSTTPIFLNVSYVGWTRLLIDAKWLYWLSHLPKPQFCFII